jgi:3'-phosphoadenosine 5'-phosphosulfate sulfotransferase (PAPS reductase)/FAD synthetase
MKKTPSHDYAKRTGRKPMTAQMADESRLREQQWIKYGCNGFAMSSPISNPMSFWTEQDVLQYIKKYAIPIASVYGDVEYSNHTEQLRIEDLGIECEGCDELHLTGCHRTGCIFCGFGCHREESPSRFERLKITHPRQYEYCIGGGEYNEDGVWQPNKQGLGMGHVFEELNKIYGEGFIKY